MNTPVRVLHVDDSLAFVEMVAEFLDKERPSFTVESATSVAEAKEMLPDEFDCIVSDYDMPHMNGIEFLEFVREEFADLPFILYTGKGSEEVASEAISAGVTEYLQKRGGSEQYSLLAKKIENAVVQYRAKQRLTASQERLSLFIDQSALGVIEWNTDFKVVQMNESAEKILGYAEDELVGQSWKTIVPESEQEPVGSAISDLGDAEGGFHVVNENARKDGTRILCEWHNRVITDESGEVVAIFSQFQDITQRQRQREEIEMQADLFEKAQAIAQVGAWEWDLRSGDGFGTRQAAEITGLPEGMGIDSVEEWLELFHPSDRNRLEAAFDRAVKAGEEYDLKVRVVRPDGTPRWVRIRGEPQFDAGELVRIRGTMQDITDINQREAELLEANELLSTLISTLPVGVAVVDAGGEIIRANGRAEAVLGLSESELTDRTYDAPEWDIHDENGDPIPPDDLPVARVLESGEAVYNYEHGITLADGRNRWLSVNAAPVKNQDGKIEHVVATVTDETESREFNSELQAQNTQLEAFARMISHDLRNPLAVAQGRLDLIRDKYDDDEDLAIIAQALDRMAALIENLLRLAREGKEIEDVELVDLDQLAGECWETIDKADAQLQAASGLRLEADVVRLRQLIENLVRNAIEHGGDDVTISIGALESGFYIEDNGSGIPAEIQDKVFEAGFTTSERGIGYGLSIAKMVADAHGWDIQITEGTDGGARFEITGVSLAE